MKQTTLAIPDGLYAHISKQAAEHERSLCHQMIVMLEEQASASPNHLNPEDPTAINDEDRYVTDSPIIPYDIASVPLERMELTPRAYHSLKRAQVSFVGDVMSMSEAELLGVRNFGRVSLESVRARAVLMWPSLHASGLMQTFPFMIEAGPNYVPPNQERYDTTPLTLEQQENAARSIVDLKLTHRAPSIIATTLSLSLTQAHTARQRAQQLKLEREDEERQRVAKEREEREEQLRLERLRVLEETAHIGELCSTPLGVAYHTTSTLAQRWWKEAGRSHVRLGPLIADAFSRGDLAVKAQEGKEPNRLRPCAIRSFSWAGATLLVHLDL